MKELFFIENFQLSSIYKENQEQKESTERKLSTRDLILLDETIISEETEAESNTSIQTIDEEESNVRLSSDQEKVENKQELYTITKNFDFSILEYPINKELYNHQMEQEYKEAFLKFLFQKTMITNNNGEEKFYYSFMSDMGIQARTNEQYIENLQENVEYWYIDFDGDGLPELVVSLSGAMRKPQILKYNREAKSVYVYINGGNYTCNFLCAGTLYEDNPSSAGIIRYALERYDKYGKEVISFHFDIRTACEPWEYSISYINREGIDLISTGAQVSEEMWNELTIPFFYAIEHKPPGMTFTEIFGDRGLEYINETMKNSVDGQ